MIRINLLPVRAAKKKESIRFQLTVAGLVTLCVILVSAGTWFKLRSDLGLMKADIANSEQELADLKRKVGELSKLKEQKRIVQSKLDVVDRLDSARTGPVELFVQLSTAIPPKAWITGFTDSGTVVDLSGFASSKEVVADFMRGLAVYKEFQRVELMVVKRVAAREGARDMVSFSIKLERK